MNYIFLSLLGLSMSAGMLTAAEYSKMISFAQENTVQSVKIPYEQVMSSTTLTREFEKSQILYVKPVIYFKDIKNIMQALAWNYELGQGKITLDWLKDELQNDSYYSNEARLNLIKSCDYLRLEKIKSLAIDILAQKLIAPEISQRCLARGDFGYDWGDKKIANAIGQAMIKGRSVKQYWLDQLGLPKENNFQAINTHCQLNEALTPENAVLLHHAMECRLKNTPLNYVPGMENNLPKALQSTISLSYWQRLKNGWSALKPSTKATIAAGTTAAAAAIAYGLYSWWK